MEITETFYAATREEWRTWLEANHAARREIWLVSYKPHTGKTSPSYVEAVEEALCFGWIDSTGKRIDDDRTGLRFSPRRPKSPWTELNKERARRLIASGRMAPAGLASLPDLSPQLVLISDDIRAALQAEPPAWENFQHFPNGYQVMRIASIEAARPQPDLFRKRLDELVRKTRQNRMWGWVEEI